MTATTQTTYTALVGGSFEEIFNLDPRDELDLTPAAREEMSNEAETAFTAAADKILAPYGCQIIGNGEIIRQDIAANVLEWHEETVREEIANIDLSDVVDRYSNNNGSSTRPGQS